MTAPAEKVAEIKKQQSADNAWRTDELPSDEDDLLQYVYKAKRAFDRCDRLLALMDEANTVIRAFLTKYDALEPAMTEAFKFQFIHGMEYKGDNWGKELDELRAMLQPPVEGETT